MRHLSTVRVSLISSVLLVVACRSAPGGAPAAVGMQEPAPVAAAPATAEPDPAPAAAIGVGDLAPGFELTAVGGEVVTLDALRAHGPAVVVFYRGHW